MLKKYSMSIKAQSLNKNNDLNVSERYNDGFQNLSKSRYLSDSFKTKIKSLFIFQLANNSTILVLQ